MTAVTYTPISTGPNHHAELRTWARANGRSVGPNGYVCSDTVAAFDQAKRAAAAGGAR